MVNKLLKTFKIIVLVELIIFVVVIGVKHFTPSGVNATQWLAHNSDAPESFIVTVTSIGFVKEDGSKVDIWSGKEEVDLTTVSSLADVKTFNVDIPTGKYKQFAIHFSKDYKVKGSVVIDGKRYYTKTNHTGFETGPAELETLNILGQTMDTQAFSRDFNPIAEFGKSTTASDIHILIDFSNILTYYDGNSTTSNGVPGGGSMSAGMYLWNYLPVAITFGKAAKKEVYTYTSPQTTGEGQLTILYDNNDNPVSGSARPRYINNSGTQFNLYGWLHGGYGSVYLEYIKKNADGTLWIKMYDNIPQAYMGQTEADVTGYTLISNFQRSSHTGNYTSTKLGSGTYTATKTQ